jgi:hypothetical protein
MAQSHVGVVHLNDPFDSAITKLYSKLPTKLHMHFTAFLAMKPNRCKYIMSAIKKM